MPPEDHRPRCSRRRLLRAGGATAALSTAGCVATLPPLGRRVRFGRVDAPVAGPPRDRRWLPAPTAFRSVEGDHWSDDVVTPVAFSPNDLGEDVVGERYSLFTSYPLSNLDYAGVGLADVDRVVWFGPAFVAVADVDRAVARDVLDGTGYERDGTHRGWDVYGRTDLYRALAVGDDAVVVVPWRHDREDPLEDGLADVRAVVDAAEGAAPRFHEVDERYRLLSAAVGTSPATWYTGGFRAGHSAGASSFRFDASSVYYVWHWLYPEGEAPTKAEVQRTVEEHARGRMDPREALDVDVTVDGRVATVEQRQSHDRFRETHREGARPPLSTWGVDHDRAAETMTIRLEAGASIPADELAVDYHPAGPDAEPESQFAERYTTVSPGDAVTVDLSDRPYQDELPNTALVVSYDPGDAHGGARLVTYPFDAAVHGDEQLVNGRAVEAGGGRGGDRE